MGQPVPASPLANRNGDFLADLIGRDTAGRLWLYAGTGTGGSSLAGRSAGWYIIVGPGDFTGDTNADVIGRDGTGGL